MNKYFINLKVNDVQTADAIKVLIKDVDKTLKQRTSHNEIVDHAIYQTGYIEALCQLNKIKREDAEELMQIVDTSTEIRLKKLGLLIC